MKKRAGRRPSVHEGQAALLRASVRRGGYVFSPGDAMKSIYPRVAGVAFPRRVFVVGCSRSGTTLLQALLAAHTQICSFPETAFFESIVGCARERFATPTTNLWEWFLRRFHRIRVLLGIADPRGLGRLSEFLAEIKREDMADLIPYRSRSIRKLAAAGLAILDRIAQENDAPIWLEKTPAHLGYIREIERLAAPVRFIHLVRSGPAVVASLHDAAQRYPDSHWQRKYASVDECVRRWNHCARLTKKLIGQPNHRLVRYENLLANPEGVLTEICGFLGIYYQPEMIDRYSLVAPQIIRADELWKRSVFGPLHDAGEARFRELFNPATQAAILRALDDPPAEKRLG